MSKLKIIKVQMLFLDKFQHQMSYKKTRRLMTGWTTLPFYLFPLFILFFRTYIHVFPLIILIYFPFPNFYTRQNPITNIPISSRSQNSRIPLHSDMPSLSQTDHRLFPQRQRNVQKTSWTDSSASHP